MSDPWWDEALGVHPAFQVQRQAYGLGTGGDYVRGSSTTTLPQTALRYPSTIKGFEEVKGKAYLTIRPFDYITAEIAWGWPTTLEDRWDEVALVRSGFGTPTTTNDGQTVMRALKGDFDGMDDTVTPPQPVTFPPPVVLDHPLQPGQWYYYTLFFRIGPLDWVAGMTGSVLIPRNHHHAEHLWYTVPPFYQYVDEDPRARLGGGLGTLRKFLSVFGFELDQAREFVEAWQDVYHFDKCPMPLLKKLGANLNVPWKGSIGEIRYRSYIAALPDLYKVRGTAPALEFVVESVTKWECDVTIAANLLLLPDDSDFFYGTGSWATLHPATDTMIPDIATVTPTNVRLTSNRDNPAVSPPPTGYGRGVMRVETAKSVEGSPFCITCGDGVLVGREIVPLYTAVPVAPDNTYGFSVLMQCMPGSQRLVTASLLWFSEDGQPTSYLGRSDGTPVNVQSPWVTMKAQGVAPAGAYYAVAALQIAGATGSTDPLWSQWVELAGAQVYLLAAAGTVVARPPDSYLTLGDPNEKIGDKDAPGAPAGFTEYVLGSTSSPIGDPLTYTQQAVFSTFFNQQLFANGNLMNNANIAVRLFRRHPVFAPNDSRYASARTVDDLLKLPGWVEAAGVSYPLTNQITVSTLTPTPPGTSRYVMFNAFPLTGMGPAEVSAVAFVYKGTVGGVTDPLIFVSTQPFPKPLVVKDGDSITALEDASLAGASRRWLFSWALPSGGATTVSPVEGPLSLAQGTPIFDTSHTQHVWLYPQRVNMIANPSFEKPGMDFWATNGTAARVAEPAPGGGGFAGKFTGVVTAGGNLTVVESNRFPTNYDEHWTIQLMAKGHGTLKVGFIYWRDLYDEVMADWGTETIPLSPDAYTHIAVLRNPFQTYEAMLRLECQGTDLTIDRVLVERGYLTDWPYFDGDTTYGCRGDFSWYGGEVRQGASYSLWYNNRNAVFGRMFARDVDDQTLLTDEVLKEQGIVYKWIPAGTNVETHMGVIQINDLLTPIPPVQPVLPYQSDPNDPNGIITPWRPPPEFLWDAPDAIWDESTWS